MNRLSKKCTSTFEKKRVGCNTNVAAAENSFLSWLGQAAVIAVGWLVVHRQAAKRDKDKTRREVLVKITDALAGNVDEVLRTAIAYHSSDRQVSQELKLKMALQDLAIQVNGISEIYRDHALLASTRTQVGVLRRAVTGAHFEDEHTLPLADSNPQLAGIAEAALDLKRSFVKIKNKQLST